MLLSYPAVFYFEDNQSDSGYSVYFPDFDRMTQGDSIPDALNMASELLGILLADDIENSRSIPTPSPINSLSIEKNNPFLDDPDFNYDYIKEKSFVSMVNVDVSNYLNSDAPIKKTLTIPKWADKAGKELQLNFSKTLTEAIMREKIGAK
jgi:predicted RNase H-like HicB family nuclease